MREGTQSAFTLAFAVNLSIQCMPGTLLSENRSAKVREHDT